MMLLVLILILMAGGILAGISSRLSTSLPRWISLITVLTDFALSIKLWIDYRTGASISNSNWLLDFSMPWIQPFGISFHLAMDGLSLLMLVLTFFLGIFAVLISWKEIQYRVGFFHFNLLWVLAGISGVFVTMD